MDPVAAGLVLIAAVLHAAWNLTLHGAEDRVASLAVAGLASGVALLPAVVVAPPSGVLGLVLASAAAESVYGLSLAAAYRRGELSLTYPIARGVAPVLVTVGAWIVLSQAPTPLSLAGAATLGAGLVLLAQAGRRAQRLRAMAFAALTGVAIAVYSVVDARAVQTANPFAYLGLVLLLEGLVLAAVVRVYLGRLRRSMGPGIRIAVGSVGAYVLVLVAFRLAEAGRVATLRELSVLVGILLAREGPGPRTWVGAGLVVAGAVMVAV
jgi:drug/metabolite transporter (DMT)-like permease